MQLGKHPRFYSFFSSSEWCGDKLGFFCHTFPEMPSQGPLQDHTLCGAGLHPSFHRASILAPSTQLAVGISQGFPRGGSVRWFENSIYLLWVTIVTGGSRAAPAAGLADSLYCGISVWFYLHPWKRQEFLGHWVSSAWDAPFSLAPFSNTLAAPAVLLWIFSLQAQSLYF